eukprot:scaffold495_cov152-Skeletonema_menzelii.AAC.24
MNSSQQSTIALVSSSLPSLDPNGQPYSMILRGEAAELRELESALSSNHPHTREQLVVELRTETHPNDEFADAELEESQLHEAGKMANGSMGTSSGDYDSQLARKHKKRIRDDDHEEVDGSDNEEDFWEEQLICYIPYIQCTCSSWDMKNVPGELLITSIRVLFIAENKTQNDTNQNQCDDVAIDGRCIALHAMDSEPSADGGNETPVSHIYCQLSDSSGDDENMGFPSASIMVAPTNIAEDEHGNDDQMNEEDNDGGGDDCTVEVYFKPIKSESKDSAEDSCQALFNALTHLASLNAGDDSNENCGGLFSMLSMMAGMGGFGSDEMIMADDEDDGDDDMIIRFGGGNHVVENDHESDGADEAERAAMLQRLDDILVVPPELRISSDDEEGQFDDADEDDEIL